MKKSQRIKTIVELKAAEEQNSLEALGISQRKLATMQTQVDGLKQYRLDYQAKFNLMGNQGTNTNQLQEFRSFMAKLDQAISGQEYALEQAKADMANKRKNWENLHQRTHSLEKVYGSAVKAEVKHESKAEQNEQDERASRGGRVKVY
jgi:flagellar FliJ protein